MNPTPKQLAILTAIRDYRKHHGYSPTMQELADQLGVSKVTVFEHVRALERKQLIDREPHRARSLALPSSLKLPDEHSHKLLGSIAAGKPIEAIENPDTVELDQLFSSRHGTYMLRVKGDSMIEDHIADGDFVVIERRSSASDGDIVVALLEDGQATLKRFFREKDRIRLQPANGSMRPIYVEGNLRIQGVLIGVLRTFGRAALGV
ncbi:MAG: transcriptional repressor LexA [Phycisphaerales bacterium]|nr:transcriptional repressor LexA [Phycisphaerales bacterium]